MDTAKKIDAAIDTLLLNFVSTKSAALCAELVPVAVSGLTITWIMIGIHIADGTHAHPVREVIRQQLRISWIVILALSVGMYQSLVVGSLDAIGVAAIKTISGVSSFAAMLDNMAEPFDILGSQLWSKATVGFIPHAALLFAAAIVSLAQALLFAVGLGFYLLAKVTLALIMAVGPIFLLCAIWPATVKYTENWLGQALNYVFLKVLICATVTMLTSFASQYANHISNNLETINIIQAACALLICSVTLAIIILFHPQLSSALFGGASIAGIGRAVAYLLLRIASLSLPKKSTPAPPANTVSPGSPAGPAPATGPSAPLYQRNTMSRVQQ